MVIDIIPIWLLFFVTIGLILLSVHVGFRIGRRVRRKTKDELESPVASMAGAILGLQAFMLAFTFGIVSDRYDQKKSLVLDEANTIRTDWKRADFLPEPERARSTALLYDYIDLRVAVVDLHDMEALRASQGAVIQTHQQLWDMAVTNGRVDMNSDIGALYVESINQIMELHATRLGVGTNFRVPTAIWVALLSLLTLGMVALGYHCAIADSRMSRVLPILAVSFSLVIGLIATLDRPGTYLVPVPHHALKDLHSEMKAAASVAR